MANHIADVACDDDRADVESTFLQPFLTYTTPQAVAFAVNVESTYDWEADEASVPLNLMVNKVTKLGNQLVQIGGGVRYWIDSPDNGPEGLGLCLNLVLLFPC